MIIAWRHFSFYGLKKGGTFISFLIPISYFFIISFRSSDLNKSEKLKIMNTILPCYFRHPLFVVFAERVEECFEVAGTVEAAECFISRCHSLKKVVWQYYTFFCIHLFHISLKIFIYLITPIFWNILLLILAATAFITLNKEKQI